LAALTAGKRDYGHGRSRYLCASEYTCGSRAGSLYHERHDARTLAKWNVDYLKYDDCGEMNLASYAKFSVMRDAIDAAGRPMVYSFEPYTDTPKKWVGAVGNSWRTGPDALPTYASILGNAFVNNEFVGVAGPGHFNDADVHADICI
jgi:alpha-galactosidase